MRFLPGHSKPGHDTRAWCVAYSPNGQVLISGGWKDDVRLWNTRSGELLEVWPAETAIIAEVAWVDDRTVVLGASSTLLRLRAFPGGKVERTFRMPVRGIVFDPMFHPPSGWVCWRDLGDGAEEEVHLWRPRKTKAFHFITHDDMVRDVAFSPSGRRLASAGWDKRLIVGDTERGEVVLDWNARARCNALHFLDDDTLLVGCGHSVALYDLAARKARRRWTAHEDLIVSLAATPDRRLVVTASDDGSAAVWALESGKLLLRVECPVFTDAHRCVAVAPDGCTAAIARLDGRIALIDLDF